MSLATVEDEPKIELVVSLLSPIWVKFLRAYKAWKLCHIFRILGRPFWQFRGLESQEMKYVLKIY